MPLQNNFPKGSKTEQNLAESLIISAIKQYGAEFFYIPRKLVAVDDLLGEDSLSEFRNAYPIEAYFKNVDNFGGNGVFMSKFGLKIEESATITVARRRWDELVGKFGETILPNRPCEGDLLYFPLTDGLFEIRFVEHQNQFYQLGKLYTYDLKIELFQYNSETIDTGIPAVDEAALERSFDILANRIMTEGGVDPMTNETSEVPVIAERMPTGRDRDDSPTLIREKNDVLDFDESNPFADFDQ
jgi:hypothetical protein